MKMFEPFFFFALALIVNVLKENFQFLRLILFQITQSSFMQTQKTEKYIVQSSIERYPHKY